jgi:hypothetical protein
MSLAPVGDQESVRLQIVGVPDECGVALIELFPLKSGEPPGIQVVAGGVHGVGHYRPASRLPRPGPRLRGRRPGPLRMDAILSLTSLVQLESTTAMPRVVLDVPSAVARHIRGVAGSYSPRRPGR